MNWSKIAIKNPIPILVLFVIMLVLGVVGYIQLPVQDFPDLDVPTVTVSIQLPNASPDQVETEVTRIVEDSLQTLEKVEHIQSVISEGMSSTTITFELSKSTSEAVNETRDAVSRVRSQLPQDMLEPNITKITSTGQPLIVYAVESEYKTEEELSYYVDNEISKEILKIPGVASVSRQGGVTRQIDVLINQKKITELNIPIATIVSQLKSQAAESSGGTYIYNDFERVIRVSGKITSIQQLNNLHIPLSSGKYIKLGDVAEIKDTVAQRRQIAILDGKTTVAFQVYRATGESELSVASSVRKKISEINNLKSNVKISEVSNSVNRVTANYNASMQSLVEGSIFATIVVLLFLRNWRATFISIVALPLSIIPTFFIIRYMGFTLNGITLLALTLVIGVLIDDAIVEVENISRHMAQGKSPMEATLLAVEEIGMAVIATSFTLIAVFLPTAFMSGVPGKVFKQFGWTAAISVFVSLMVARLLTPLMSAYILKPTLHGAEYQSGWMMKKYLTTVRWCLAKPWLVIVLSIVFFTSSILVAKQIPLSFIPRDDRGQITVSVELPSGTPISQTVLIAKQVEELGSKMPEVKSAYIVIGASGGSTITQGIGQPADTRKGSVILMLIPKHERVLSQNDIENKLRTELQKIPGAKFTISGGGAGEKYSLVLASDNPKILEETAKKIIAEIRSIPGLGGVSSSVALLRPELQIDINTQKAASLGVNLQQAAQAIKLATIGDLDKNLPKLNLPTRQVPIVLKVDQSGLGSINDALSMKLPGTNGAVSLSEIATISLKSKNMQLDRFDRHRNIIISVELNGQPLGEVAKNIGALNSVKNLPNGVINQPYGEAERMKELFLNFVLAMVTGILCIYLVLILLFKDLLQPFSVLGAIPLSSGGAFLALWIFGHSLSLPSMIGLIMLIGIVTKNSILLIDYAIIAYHKNNIPRTEAIIDACLKRARPIVMTSIAMIAGMVPMAFGLGDNLSFRAPMAIAVIGGLITSTVLSLMVIPVLFELVDDIKIYIYKKIIKK